MAFGLDFFTVAPGLRLAGDSLAYAYKFTGKGGELKGLEGLEIGLVDDPTVKLIEGTVSGYETVADRDAVYTTLVVGGLTELVPGLAIGIDSLSSIETGSSAVRLAVAGSQPVLLFRKANVQAVTKIGDGGYTWDLPTATFEALKTAAESYQSDLATKVEQMIAARISADGVLQAAIDSQATSDATARAAIQADVDQNEADADAADAALSGRLDVLESDATTATAVAAVQSDVDQNEADSDAADAALSGRLDVLEADPTTQTALTDGLALKADLAGATFTGDIVIDEGTGSTVKLETSDATSAGIHIEGPSGSMGYLDTTNGFGNDSLQVYSANFWVRAINGGTGNVIIDGSLTLGGTVLTASITDLNQLDGVTLGTAASTDSTAYATAAQGATADTAAQLDGTNIPGPYNNDSEAATGGVAVGAIYKNTNGTIHWRVS